MSTTPRNEIVAGVIRRSRENGVEQHQIDVIQIDETVEVEIVGDADGVLRSGTCDRHARIRPGGCNPPLIASTGIGLADGPAQAVATTFAPGVSPTIHGGPGQIVASARLGRNGDRSHQYQARHQIEK